MKVSCYRELCVKVWMRLLTWRLGEYTEKKIITMYRPGVSAEAKEDVVRF